MAAERSARARDVVVERDVAVVAETDRPRALSWGPITAGLLAALGVFVLLSLLAVTVGATVVTPDGNPPTTIATIVAALIALVSFFGGGYVAAWSARIADETLGALNGFLVWALFLVVVLIAGGLGLGSLFGTAGSLLDDISAPEMSRQQVVNALQAGSWRTFLALGLAAAAAALGGAIGAWSEGKRRMRQAPRTG